MCAFNLALVACPYFPCITKPHPPELGTYDLYEFDSTPEERCLLHAMKQQLGSLSMACSYIFVFSRQGVNSANPRNLMAESGVRELDFVVEFVVLVFKRHF
jgi:hypothetical protein